MAYKTYYAFTVWSREVIFEGGSRLFAGSPEPTQIMLLLRQAYVPPFSPALTAVNAPAAQIIQPVVNPTPAQPANITSADTAPLDTRHVISWLLSLLPKPAQRPKETLSTHTYSHNMQEVSSAIELLGTQGELPWLASVQKLAKV